MLFGAVLLVLLVACGNVASMLLARSARRQGEFAVRASLGASRSHLVRLALVESLVLASAGAVVGVAFALAGVQALRWLAPASEARKAAISLNLGALGFGLAATVVTTLLAGLPPAFAAMRTSVSSILRADARGAMGSRERHRMLRTLVIGQVALAFVLANGAVLLSSGYLKLLKDNENLATDTVCTAKVALNGPRYEKNEQRVQFWREFADRVGALPGVSRAAITSKLPLEGGSNTSGLVNDEVYDPTQRRLQIERTSATSDYFAAMGIHLLKGRGLQKEDGVGEIQGAVVNRRFVERAWPNKDPLGEIVRGDNPGKPWYTVRVVGVVEDVKQWGPSLDVQPEMYLVPEGHWGQTAILVFRSNLPLPQITPMLRHELAAIDGELALKDVRTMRMVVASTTQGDRAVTSMVNFFMALALGLVAVGLYGTLSYHVQQRTREIGVRVAVGALKGHIVKLVFSQGGRWVGLGVILGLAGCAALTSVFKSITYHTPGLSAPPLLFATLGVGLATLVACWLPAQRAARLDPIEALRSD
jgi:predicted permease